MQQVIRIDQFGRALSLRMTEGKGFDLRKLGTVQMRRISEVLMDEDTQMYYCQFQDGSYLVDGAVMEGKSYTLFDTYEQAVQAEIRHFNQKIKAGSYPKAA